MTSEAGSVDSRPQWLINIQAAGTQRVPLVIDGKQYAYTIVRTGLEPRLPYVVAYLGADVLFISSDVPQEFREFILAHEIREQSSLADLPEEERCTAALVSELEDIRVKYPERYKEYVNGNPETGFKGRRDFFDHLNTFYQDPQQKAARTPAFIEGIDRARDYLHKLDVKIL